MPEDNKPIFPRKTETDKEAQPRLEETRQKLENQEQTFGLNEVLRGHCKTCGAKILNDYDHYCLNCGGPLRKEEIFLPMVTHYGPPPMPISKPNMWLLAFIMFFGISFIILLLIAIIYLSFQR